MTKHTTIHRILLLKIQNKSSGMMGLVKEILRTSIIVGLVVGGHGSLLASESVFYDIAPSDRIFSVDFRDEEVGWLVGDRGLALKTTDGGNRWQKIAVPVNEALYDITFVEQNGWIVGKKGVILHTGDGGGTWKPQQSNTDRPFTAVTFLDKKRGFAVGGAGTILQTENGGASWEICPLDLEMRLPEELVELGMFFPNFYDLFFLDEMHGWVVGDYGIVLETSDGGKHWEVLRAGVLPSLFSVFFTGTFEGWVVGEKGLFLHTKDGGKTWAEVSIPVKEDFYKVRFAGPYGIVVGDQGTVLESNDHGKTWNQMQVALPIPFLWFTDVSIMPASSSQRVLCVGKGNATILPAHSREEETGK